MSDASTPASSPAAPVVEGQVDSNPTDTQPAAPPKPQKRFIKVGDESIDEETITRDYKKWKGADQKFRETAQAKQSIDAFYEALQKDPKKLLSDPRLPIDRRQLALDLMREQIEAEMLESDPEAKRMSDTEKELQTYKEREAREKEARERQQYEAVVSQRREALASTLSKALELTPLSKNPAVQAETLREMATYMRLARQAGYEASPEELAHHVSGNKLSSYRTLAEQMEGDELLEFFGEKIAMKMRKADLSRIRKAREQPAPETAPQEDWRSRSESGKKREFVDPMSLRRK